jgi:hypothetical protein
MTDQHSVADHELGEGLDESEKEGEVRGENAEDCPQRQVLDQRLLLGLCLYSIGHEGLAMIGQVVANFDALGDLELGFEKRFSGLEGDEFGQLLLTFLYLRN